MRSTVCANDGAGPDRDRPRLAARTFASASAELPVPAELLGLCDHRNPTLWGGAGQLARIETHLPLPSMGRPGLRPGSVREMN